MQTLNIFLYVLQVIVAISLVGLILLQHGKGADAGAAFGSGASATVFGSRGAGGFLSKLTAILAAVFLVNGLLLAYVATEFIRSQQGSVLDRAVSPVTDRDLGDAPPPVEGSLGDTPFQAEGAMDMNDVPLVERSDDAVEASGVDGGGDPASGQVP